MAHSETDKPSGKYAYVDHPEDKVYDKDQYPYFKVKHSNSNTVTYYINNGIDPIIGAESLLMDPTYSYLYNNKNWIKNITNLEYMPGNANTRKSNYIWDSRTTPPTLGQPRYQLVLTEDEEANEYFLSGQGVDPGYMTHWEYEYTTPKNENQPADLIKAKHMGYGRVGNFIGRYEYENEVVALAGSQNLYVICVDPAVAIRNYSAAKGAYWTGDDHGPTNLKELYFDFDPTAHIYNYFYDSMGKHKLWESLINSQTLFEVKHQTIETQYWSKIYLPILNVATDGWGSALSALNTAYQYNAEDITVEYYIPQHFTQVKTDYDDPVSCDMTIDAVVQGDDWNLILTADDVRQLPRYNNPSDWSYYPSIDYTTWWLKPITGSVSEIYEHSLLITPRINWFQAYPALDEEKCYAGWDNPTYVNGVLTSGPRYGFWLTVDPQSDWLYKNDNRWKIPYVDEKNDRVFYNTIHKKVRYREKTTSNATNNVLVTWSVNQWWELWQGTLNNYYIYNLLSTNKPDTDKFLYFVWEWIPVEAD